MKIFIGFISLAWLILIIVVVAINVLNFNFNTGVGIAGAIGLVIGGMILSIPSYFGIKYSNGGQTNVIKTALNGTNMNQLNKNKFPEATVVGVVLIFVTINVIVLLNLLSLSDNSSKQFINIFNSISIILRIGITIWVVNISKVLKKNQLSWGIFAFFLPSISLIVIGQSSKRRLVSSIDHVDNIPLIKPACNSVVDNSNTIQVKKDLLIDLKSNGVLSETEYQEKFELILKQEDSIKDQINTEKIQNLVIEKIQPYLNQLSELTKANILTQEEYVDIPVILTPYSGHIDPPTGSWF